MKDNKIIKKLSDIKLIYWVIVLFVLSVIVHFFMNSSLKTIHIYPDELRFYDIARNMHNGFFVAVRGIKIDYQKILYSLFLYPFFYIKDVVLRMKIISFANCMVMCSSIFPMYMIYKQMYNEEERKKIDILLFILFAFSSMMLYTATYMSENLYAPLYLWTIVSILNAIKNRNIISYIVMAILSFITYMCREIMLIYVVSIVVSYIILNLKDFENDKKNIIDACVYIGVFLLLNIVCKIILFKNMHYTYGTTQFNQISIDAISSMKVFFICIYDALYFLAGVLIVFLYFPIIILINQYQLMNDKEKFVLLSNAINIILMSATVAYTISIREDIEETIIRLHLRYVIVSIVLMLFICLKHFGKNSIKMLAKKKYNILILMGMVVFSFVFFNGLNVYNIDQTFLHWYRILRDNVQTLVYGYSNYTRCLEVDIIIIVIVIIGVIVLKMKKYNIFKHYFVVIMLLMFVSNNIYGGIDFNHAYEATINYVKDIDKIEKSLKNDKGNILYIGEGTHMAVVDTYFENGNKVYFQNIKDIDERYSDNYVRNIDMVDYDIDRNYDKVDMIEYILIDKAKKYDDIVVDNAKIVEDIGLRNYRLYRNNGKKVDIYIDVKNKQNVK